jgi:hypothetical protein
MAVEQSLAGTGVENVHARVHILLTDRNSVSQLFGFIEN